MTTEQAIKELEESYDIMRNHDIDESESYLMQALGMAIKALQAQADGDLISRQDIFHMLDEVGGEFESPRKAVVSIDSVVDMIAELPSVAIPTEHDGCKDCKYESFSQNSLPCS